MNPTSKARIEQIARSVLADQLSILEACRLIRPLVQETPEVVTNEDYNLIVAIESETDDLPIGRLRELWHPDFLPEKDSEIARCEALWRKQVIDACERILLRMSLIN